MIKKYVGKALAPTCVVTLIFLLNYWCFGMENTIIGPFLTLSFLKLQNMERYYGCMLKSFGIYGIMALLAWLALLHPALNLCINGMALFWIGYFLIDEYNPLNYFPAGMALIFFQISPVKSSGLVKRLAAIFVSFLLVFFFLEVKRFLNRGRDSRILDLSGQGLTVGRQLVECLKRKELDRADRLRLSLCKINRSLSLALYERNRSALTRRVEENRYSSFIACFQMIGYLADQVQQGDVEEGTVQLEQMELLLDEFETQYRTGEPQGSNVKYRFRENPLDLRSFRLRFALRQVLVMTPCLLYGALCPRPNGYWLAISVFFMMIPVYEQTITRVTQRVLGSFCGILICLVAFFFLRDFWPRVLLMTIANFFIYCSGSYTSMVAGITCSALALNFGTDSYVLMLGQRMAYTLAGAVIAIGANMWIFPIKAYRQCQYVMELLDELKERLAAAGALELKEQKHYLGQYMVKSYLLSSRMEEFHNTVPPKKRREDVERFLKEHMLFSSKIVLRSHLTPRR